ncbi:MAG: PAS domain S-box protein, partial [Verrucomicrobiota bacterium]
MSAINTPFTGPQPTAFRQQAEELARLQAARTEDDLQNLSPEEIKLLLHGLQVRQIELELENAALQQSQQHVLASHWNIADQRLANDEIKRQSALIHCLLDSIPDFIFYKDLDSRYVSCNLALANLLGRTRAEIIGKTDYELFDKDLAGHLQEMDQGVFDSGETRRNEEWVPHPDGRQLLLETLKTPFRGDDGALIGVLGISRDVTERKRIERALVDSEQSYRNQFEHNSAVMLLVDPADGTIVDANHEAEHFYGYPAGQLRSMNIADINTLGDTAICKCMVGVDKSHGKQFQFQHRLADGSLRDVEVLSSRIQFGERMILHSIIHDVTARTRVEAALRDSETNFRVFFESVADMILVATPEGRVMFSNHAVIRTLGYRKEDLQQMHLLDLHPATSRAEAEEIVAALFRGERDTCPLPLETHDGRLIPVETRISRGKWDGVDCIFGICKDLTAEQEASRRFEALFRGNPALIAFNEMPGEQFVDANDSFLQALGYTPGEVIGKTPAELGLFPHPAQQAEATKTLISDGRFSNHEIQLAAKDGAVLDGLCSGDLITVEGRQYLITVVIDVTRPKQTERELARVSTIQRELMHLATAFVNVPMERQDEAIQQSLATMGQIIAADRAYLFTYDLAGGTTSNTHEWCAAGIRPQIGNQQQVPLAALEESVAAHRLGLPVSIASVAALPPASTLRAMLEAQDIRSVVSLPLMQDGVCLGFVGFDAVLHERVWQEGEIALLRV